MGVPARHRVGTGHVELAPDLDGMGAFGRVHQDGTAVGVLQVELPVVGLLGLVPTDVDLHGDGRGHRIGAGERPAAPEHEELPVGHLGRVTQAASSLSRRARLQPARRPVASAAQCPNALRDDVYRRPLATALERLGARHRGGAASTSVPAGGTCRWRWPRSSGRDGRVYAVDSDPRARDEAAAGGGGLQPGARHHPGRRGPASCPSRSTWPSAGSCSCTSSTPPSCSGG